MTHNDQMLPDMRRRHRYQFGVAFSALLAALLMRQLTPLEPPAEPPAEAPGAEAPHVPLRSGRFDTVVRIVDGDATSITSALGTNGAVESTEKTAAFLLRLERAGPSFGAIVLGLNGCGCTYASWGLRLATGDIHQVLVEWCPRVCQTPFRRFDGITHSVLSDYVADRIHPFATIWFLRLRYSIEKKSERMAPFPYTSIRDFDGKMRSL